MTVKNLASICLAGKNPALLAEELAGKIKSGSFFQIKAVGPYINFFVNQEKISGQVIGDLLKKAKSVKKGEKIMIEYFSPNTNKPMTVGHLRNLTLGATISRLYKKMGYQTIESCLFNDRGIAITKSMLAYEKWGKNQNPKIKNQKSDQFVGDYYVLFGQKVKEDPSLDNEALEMLNKWELASAKASAERGAEDKKVLALWKKMNSWVYAGFKETLKKLNEGKFDAVFYESKFYDKAKEIVLKNIGKGVIKRGDEGEVMAYLEPLGLPNKVLLRSDGTSLYITQDLYLAELKEKYHAKKSVYVVGDEQNLQLRQLFTILATLGKDPRNYYHLSYGMMRLPEGKIKSREGFGRALADALIENLEEMASQEIISRQKGLSKAEIKKIANQIMNGALKFYILNIDPAKQMVFDPGEAISFNGKTGPYLQYSVVRLNSIVKKSKNQKIKKSNYSLLQLDLEKRLINLLKDYQDVLEKSLADNSPAALTHYLFELAQISNTYYHEVGILKSEPKIKQARLALIRAVANVLTDGLSICGIEIPKKM